MCPTCRFLFLKSVIVVLVVIPAGPIVAQTGAGGARIGGSRIGGAGIGTGGARGLSSPRSGLGVRNSPVVNPSPSLTPSQVLNPRGSLNAGQVLNPEPSLNRPRTGVTAPGTNGREPASLSDAPNQAPYRAGSDRGPSELAMSPKSRVSRARPVGTRILSGVVALDGKISKVAPGKDWSERLSLDVLRLVPLASEQPASEEERKQLEGILQTFQEVAADEQLAEINQLPEFKRTFSALEDYLTPLDVRKRKQLLRHFDQLQDELGEYKNGGVWVEYLALPEGLASGSDDEDESIDAGVKKLLGRFEKLSSNKAYRKVTSLPGFQPAYESLQALAAK